MEKSEILSCPCCEDQDCKLNICGKCHDIGTILAKVPDGMYTCSGVNIEFERTDYIYMEMN